jgi:hypothetical protein
VLSSLKKHLVFDMKLNLRIDDTLRLALALTILVFVSCTGNSGNDSSDGSPSSPAAPGPGSRDFSSDCGTVVQERLVNPASSGNAILASARVAGPNALIVSLPSGEQLVKLHNIQASNESSRDNGAISTLASLTSSDVWYFPSSLNCSVNLPGGGQGVTGQFFTQQGVNLSERLIELGRVNVAQDPCGGNLTNSCYQALLEESRSQIGGQVSNFLWKPQGENNKNVAVLFNPAGSVVVNGESFAFTGASNGRATTARGSKPGCAYGNNIRLELRDSEGRRLVGPNGDDVIVPSGCSRFEF